MREVAAASSNAREEDASAYRRTDKNKKAGLPTYFSSSPTMRSIPSFESRPLSLMTVMRLDLLTRRLVASVTIQDTVRVDVKADLNLGHIARRRRNTQEIKLPGLLLSFVRACSPSKTWFNIPG